MQNRLIIFFITLIGITGIAIFFLPFLQQTTTTPSAFTIKPSSTLPHNTSPETIATNLEIPWAIAFLPASPNASQGGPDVTILITERTGAIKTIRNGILDQDPLATIDEVKASGEGGLLGIAVDPEFEQNNFIYIYYTYDDSGANTKNRVVRFKLTNKILSDKTILVDAIPGASNHDGGRIAFGPDGFLYITTGDAQEPSLAQNTNSLAGKILRVTKDGKAATDNPFNNRVYSYGHRNPQGISWDENGNLWETEHGPSGGFYPNCCQDEINKIIKGKNYGWPNSVGNNISTGTVGPILHSGKDTWAPGSVLFYNGSLYFGGLKGSALYKYTIENKKLTEHFKNEFGRIRDIVLGPDGFFYITTSNRDGRGIPSSDDDKIIRIDPSTF